MAAARHAQDMYSFEVAQKCHRGGYVEYRWEDIEEYAVYDYV